MSTSQIVLKFVCPKYRSLKWGAELNAYVSPRARPRELCRLEIVQYSSFA